MAIASVTQRGSIAYIYDEKGKNIGSISIGSGGELRGYTASTVSIKRGGTIYIYDEKGRHISCHNA